VAETIERNLALRSSPTARSLKRYANRFNLKQRYTLRLERGLLRDPHGPTVVALSDYVVEQLRRHYALPDGRIRKVFNGVDPDPTTPGERARHRDEIRREYDVPAAATLVLCVAHNFRLKGVARWMEALAILRDRGVNDVRSLVLGRDDSVRWRRLVDRLSLNSHLTFVGPTDRVREFYHAADVLVHPTYYDPCSRVVLEAMSSGLACITTRWDGAAEVVSDGVSGFVLAEPTDVGRLADCVQKLRHPALRKAMGEAARVSSQRGSMAQHARELLAVYEDVVDRGRPAADRRSRVMESA
jgi:UDP-glucose:(heptosyl)LPS alpha-1,3-glucosyltransferase